MAQKPALKRPEGPAGALRLLVLAIGAMGANIALAQTVTVSPSVQTRLTWTDNVGASRDKEADWIAEVSPGITVSRESGRFSGNLAAQLRNVAYARDTERNDSFVTLQGRGEVEAVENLLFVDVDGNISRNNRSLFSGRSSDDELSTDEDNETRTWSIGPRLELRFGESTSGSVRYRSRWLESGGSTVSDQRLEQWTAQLANPGAMKVFGWGLDYTRSRNEYGDNLGRDSTLEIGRATLFINLSPQVRLRAIAGREANDYETGANQRGSIYGAGLDWYPSERTSFSATTEDRIFGTGYDVSFRHRAARSTWDLSYVRDFSSSLDTFSRDNDQLALAETICQAFLGLTALPPPGPILDNYDACLASLGVSRLGGTSIVSNAQFLQESFRAGLTLLGVRNTLTFSLQRSDRARLTSLAGLSAQDDFALSEKIRTTSATVSLNHRLSGLSSLTAALSRSHSEGDSASEQDTKRLTATIGLSTRLGPRTNGGLSYRHQRSDGTGASSNFTENAVIANLGMTF